MVQSLVAEVDHGLASDYSETGFSSAVTDFAAGREIVDRDPQQTRIAQLLIYGAVTSLGARIWYGGLRM